MKTKSLLVLFVVTLFSGFSCSKSDIEKGIDCVGESTFVHVSHTTDATNPKKIDFTADYNGNYTFTSVKWEYGDGTSETVTSHTVSHIYSAAGTYTVKSTVTIKNGNNTCSSTPTKSVTVN